MEHPWCKHHMTRKSAGRFCCGAMHEIKNLKRIACIGFRATRFNTRTHPVVTTHAPRRA